LFGGDNAVTFDPDKLKLQKTVSGEKVGFWCAAINTVTRRLFAGGTDSQIHVYDWPALTRSTRGPLRGHTSYVTALAQLAKTDLLVSGSFDRQLMWWQPETSFSPVRQVAVGTRVNRLAASPDGRWVAAATEDLVGRVWDTGTGKLAHRLEGGHPTTTRLGRRNTLYSIVFSPDGKQIATGDRAGTIALWEMKTGKRVRQLSATSFYSQAMQQAKMASEYEWGGVRALAFSPDGQELIAGGMGPADQNSAGIDGPMRLESFNPATGNSLMNFMVGPKGLLTTLFFSADGGWAVAAGGGGKAGASGIGSLWLWNFRKQKDGKRMPPLTYQSPIVVREVLPAPDGNSLLAVGMLNDVFAGRIDVWGPDLSPSATGSARPAVPKKEKAE
jgi:WD40 repeat protein